MLVSIFNDVIGPVMVGPSSSHTAGAVRIGLFARRLLGGRDVFADIPLPGKKPDNGESDCDPGFTVHQFGDLKAEGTGSYPHPPHG